MDNLEKFEFYLNQLFANINYVSESRSEIVLGNLGDNILYKNNYPLTTTVKLVDEENFDIHLGFNSIDNFDIQYIYRISNTPFYVSSLTNDRFSLKILDFYDWKPITVIYRIIFYKSLRYGNDSLIFNINMAKNPKEIKHQNNIFHINAYKKSNIKTENNKFTLHKKSGTFAIVLNFTPKISSSNTLDLLIKKFHILNDICISKHIKNYFCLKDKVSENELDLLWTQQKFVFPDFDFNLKYKIHEDKNYALWLKEFYLYFGNRAYDSFLENNDSNFIEKKGLYNNLSKLPVDPSNLVNLYFKAEFDLDINKESVQLWWNIYSLPIFRNALMKLFKDNIELIFIIYFLTLRYNLPFSDEFFKLIRKYFDKNNKTFLDSFLLLLAFMFKRIIRLPIGKNDNFYIPSSYFDNNFKSIKDNDNKLEFINTKFSNDIYTTFNFKETELLKIDKLCIIKTENSCKNLFIYPLLLANKDLNKLEIKNDNLAIELPLVWSKCSISSDGLRLKWLLKKNRFQITVHSNKSQKLNINNKIFNLEKGKKVTSYVDIVDKDPAIDLSIYNEKGCTIFSKNQKNKNIILSGIVLNAKGILTNKILYSIDKKKHILQSTPNLDIINSKIILDMPSDKVQVYFKRNSNNYKFSYYENEFIDKLLNIKQISMFILQIDLQFLDHMPTIMDFFNNLFGFRPDFTQIDYKLFKSNPSYLYFCLKNKQMPEKDHHVFNIRKNAIIFEGENVIEMLKNFIKLLEKNIKKSNI